MEYQSSFKEPCSLSCEALKLSSNCHLTKDPSSCPWLPPRGIVGCTAYHLRSYIHRVGPLKPFLMCQDTRPVQVRIFTSASVLSLLPRTLWTEILLCCPVVIVVKQYLSRTNQYHPTCSNLFISNGRQKWVTKNTIIFWLRSVIKEELNPLDTGIREDTAVFRTINNPPGLKGLSWPWTTLNTVM